MTVHPRCLKLSVDQMKCLDIMIQSGMFGLDGIDYHHWDTLREQVGVIGFSNMVWMSNAIVATSNTKG